MQAYTAAFAGAASMEIPAIPNEMPLVGRRGGSGPAAYKPAQAGAEVSSPSGYSVEPSSTDGAYNYGRGKTPRPEGVPGKLPKETKWRKTPVQDAQIDAPVPDLPAEN